MSLPIVDVSHVIGVDDVQPAELMTRVFKAHNSTMDHFNVEHDRSGVHQIPVVPSAVARWRAPATRTLSTVVNGAGGISFAIGFAQAPRLVVGADPFFRGEGYYLRWKLARPVGRAWIAVTAGWTSSGNPTVYHCRGDRQGNGAIRLWGLEWNSDSPVLPDEIKNLSHMTIAVHELREAD